MKYKKTILIILPDFCGYFYEMVYNLVKRISEKNERIEFVFAITSPYYQKFKNISFADYGTVYFLSDFLENPVDTRKIKNVELNYWITYSTFVRQKYFLGKHVNDWDDYRKVFIFFEKIFNSYSNISLIWSEPVSTSFSAISFVLSQKYNIPFYGYQVARIPGFYNISINFNNTLMLKNPLPPTYSYNKNDKPDYQKVPETTLAKTSSLYFIKGSFKKVNKGLKSGIFQSSLETGKSVFRWQTSSNMKFIYRIFYHTYLNSFTSIFKNLVYYPDKIDKNFIFPLQYRPEASTSVLSPYYENDIEVIKNIAFSLPHGSWLYVKEHEGSVGNRKLSFYKEILTYPNVRLLDIYFPVKENWSLFKGVITLTSTMGFEALQNGVPVILLGNTFYQEYNDVIRISGWEQLPNELNKLARKQKGVSNKNILKKYLDYCFEGSFNIRSNEVLKSDNIDKLIIPIIRALKNSNT